MKQIIPTASRLLHNNEHDQLHSDIEGVLVAETPVTLDIEDEFAAYQQARVAQRAAMQIELGSMITRTITQTDGFRDQMDCGFEMLVESHLYHFDPVVQEKARCVKRILDQYGNIRKLGYNAESSEMTNRNAELTTNYAAEVAAMGNGLGTLWLSKMSETNNGFINHFGDRADEVSARISGNVLDARKVVEEKFQKIATRINALVVINGEGIYGECIDKINYYINYHKATLAARQGRSDAGATTVTQ